MPPKAKHTAKAKAAEAKVKEEPCIKGMTGKTLDNAFRYQMGKETPEVEAIYEERFENTKVTKADAKFEFMRQVMEKDF